MEPVPITAYEIASRFIGTKEHAGQHLHNPLIVGMLKLDDDWPQTDETPWCSAFVNFVCFLVAVPRTRSLRARSWLTVGEPVALEDAEAGFDLVILNRADGPQDPSIIEAPGHVGFFAALGDDETVLVLGGNQGNAVSIAPYPRDRVLGVRRVLRSS